jgi:hypothetical protein
MTEEGLRRATRAAAALGIAVWAFASPARAADVEIQVSTADGKKFTGTLYAGEQVLPVESGKAKLTVRGLDLKKRIAVAADLRVDDTKGKPPLRYLAVVEVMPGRGPVQLKAEPVKDLDQFCSGCHPSEKAPVKETKPVKDGKPVKEAQPVKEAPAVKEGQIVRDLHPSGQELKGRYLAQVGKFKEYIEKKRKEGKERPPEPVVLEERIVIVDGKEVKKFYYTCESCHTLHWKTPWTKYARAAFSEKGTLCAGCHY